jgi:hypothetical protein
VRKAYGDGKHNAFTAFVKWKGAYWLAFRNGTSHGSRDGDIVLLYSTDARSWQERKRFNVWPDDRDPQMLATDERLFLYDIAERGGALTSFVMHTDDGNVWSKPEPVYLPQYIFWKPLRHNGRFWAAAHKADNDGKKRDVHLITSTDAIKWEKVSTIRAGNWESETTLFMDGDRAVAFLRSKYANPRAQILESKAPYTEWKARTPNLDHFSGHSCHTFNGVTYFLTRTLGTIAGKPQSGQGIFTFESDGTLKPYCTLPAGGDCAYAQAVVEGDHMLVSYYSGHETDKPVEKTNVYVAVVPLKK